MLGTTEQTGYESQTYPRVGRSWPWVSDRTLFCEFYIRASRTLTHELVRHRLASYSQRSQDMWRRLNRNTSSHLNWIILSMQLESLNRRWFHAWKAYKQSYSVLGLSLKSQGMCFLMHAKTQIVMTMNFRELRHFIRLRTGAQGLAWNEAVAGTNPSHHERNSAWSIWGYVTWSKLS